MDLIQASFGSMEGTRGDLSSQVEQLMQVIEDMMSKVNSTEWEANDRSSYQELQELWNTEDTGLQDVLQQISTQVGTAQEGYTQTIAHNAGRF